MTVLIRTKQSNEEDQASSDYTWSKDSITPQICFICLPLLLSHTQLKLYRKLLFRNTGSITISSFRRWGGKQEIRRLGVITGELIKVIWGEGVKETTDSAKTIQTGHVSSPLFRFFFIKNHEMVVEDGKLNEAALLFSFSVFFFHQSDIRGRLDHSKENRERRGEKKAISNSNSHTLIPHLLPSRSPSLPLLVSPVLCEKLEASVARAQSVEVAGFWTMPQSEPQDSWVHRERSTSLGSRPWLKALYCDCQLQDRGSQWRRAPQSGGRRLGQKERQRDESWALQLGEDTIQYTRETITAGHTHPLLVTKR